MTNDPDVPTVMADPVSQDLLGSRQMAQLAYTWLDGSPRVVPICFHWNGSALVLGTPVGAPKVRALDRHPDVAVTIEESGTWPYRALLLRGRAVVDLLDDVGPEYELAVHRYMGDEAGEAWVSGLRGVPMARITIEPQWARVLDFVTRFPSALSA